MKLRIAEDLTLPIDVATQTLLIVGKRGSGKSSTATRFAEQMIGAGVPIAVLDPVDVWWGLKAGHDGARAGGLEVYVFGGAHRDLTLEPTAGALMADTLVDHRINAVFVLREFSNREKARFVSDFAERLFQRNRDVMHLFCEEAHEVMPQQPYGGEEEMLGRMLRLQKLGRTSGIGLSSITQRPASLNKNATTQAEVLIAHRLLGPQDRAAIEQWIKHHHVEELKNEVLATLPELKTGEAWIWSPDFPEEKPIGLRRVRVLMPETFDSRRTPKPGERRAEPKQLAPVDLDKLRDKMAATIERTKSEDPDQLRKTIAALRREITGLQKATAPTKLEIKTVEKRILTKADIGALSRAATKLLDASERFAKIGAVAEELGSVGRQILGALSAASSTPARAASPAAPDGARGTAPRTMTTPRVAPRPQRTQTPEGISRVEQRILDGLAEFEVLGVPQPERVQVAFLAGYTNLASKGFANAIGALRTAGYIDYPTSGRIVLTATGRAIANFPDQPRSSDELQRRVIDMLGGAGARILRPLIETYPDPLDRDELGRRAGYTNTASKGFANAIGRLRSLGFIDYPERGKVVAQPVLFLEERV